MAVDLVLDDPSVSVTLQDGAGHTSVTLRNMSSTAITPHVRTVAHDGSAIAIRGGGPSCSLVVPTTSLSANSTAKVTVAFAGCRPPDPAKVELVVADAPHAITIVDPTTISGDAIVGPLAIGGIAFVVAALAAFVWLRIGPDRVKNVLRDAPTFSLKDGWLTSLTGVSAAAVAVFSSAGLADALLPKRDQLDLAIIGLIVVALLGLSPVLLNALTSARRTQPASTTSPDEPAPTDAPASVPVIMETWLVGFLLGAAITLAAVATQLTALWIALDHALIGTDAENAIKVFIVLLELAAIGYVVHFASQVAGLSVRRHAAHHGAPTAAPNLPWSLSL